MNNLVTYAPLPLPPTSQLVLAKTQEKVVTSLTEVTWLGKKLPVRSEKLKLCLVKVGQLESELGRVEGGEEKTKVYEQLLMECQDALQIVREEISAEEVRRW